MRLIRVTFDAKFSAEPGDDGLAAMGDALMEALIDVGAIDPFVSIDTGTNSLVVEVVVEAEGQAGALGGDVGVIDTALQAGGIEKRMALRGSTVRTEDVVPG